MESNNLPNYRITKNEEIPSLEFYQKAFAEFRGRIENLSKYEDIKQAFVDSFHIYPPIGLIPTVSIDSDMYIYRARVIDESVEDITATVTYSYNKDRTKVKQGRANLARFPVFYGAGSQDTAIRETKVIEENNPILYISKWKFRKGTLLNNVTFIFDELRIELVEDLKLFNEAREVKMREMLNIYSIDEQDSFMYLFKEISNAFLDEDHKISSFLAHYYLHEGKERFKCDIDLMLYPSIQSKYIGVNFAFRPDFVDSFMELIEVQKVRLKKYNENRISHIALLNTGSPDNSGRIKWPDVVLSSDNMEINALGIVVKDYEGKHIPLDAISEVVFLGTSMPVEELVESLIIMRFDDICKSCWQGIKQDDMYGKHEIDINLVIEEGLMTLESNRDLCVSNLLLNIHYHLVNEKIIKKECQ